VLSRLSFASKMLLLPAMAAAALLLSLVLTAWLGGRNGELIDRVQNGYYPSFELSLELEDLLAQIQQGLRDAVAAGEVSGLEQTDRLRDRALQALETAKSNPARTPAEIEALRNAFTSYYRLARGTSARLLAGETGEGLTAALERMRGEYVAIEQELTEGSAAKKQEMFAAFAAALAAQRRTTLLLTLVTAAWIVVLLAFALYLARSVTRPLGQVTSVAVALARGDLTAGALLGELDTRRRDELGGLINGFKSMLDQIQSRDRALQEARDNLEQRVEARTEELRQEILERERAEAQLAIIHRQLLEASRRGGMAEIATNVLHNVGNVLNSVNVSATLVAESVRQSRAPGLVRAAALLHEHEHDLAHFVTADPRGRHLPAYLAQLGEQLRVDQQLVVEELESLRANIEHIRDIVAMQQSYAKVSGVRELVDVAELVEDSLRINFGALNRHGITVVREFAAMPPILIDKNKVLQILVNLVRNAKYACDEGGDTHKRVTLQVAEKDGKVEVRVIDNGVGILPENVTRIFNHGFTTRTNGHGFGLHSGALAATEIGGALYALSEGTGQGATFILELPIQDSGDDK
jgi:nitrogen fixation/metabolism regulation signal transduction histidine kinase